MITPASTSETHDLAPEILGGLAQLARAHAYACEMDCDLWEFAVEIDRLVAAGMTTGDLRWLAKRGYVCHAREATRPEDPSRRFDAPGKNLAFGGNTCFVITEIGLAALAESRLPLDGRGERRPSGAGVPSLQLHGPMQDERISLDAVRVDAKVLPNWDREGRIFHLGDQVIKRFRVPSPNQEAVLEAFQEEGWPQAIDDPLPPVPDQQPKKRLRDTIKCLNLNQQKQLIRFRGDGTGQRVLWELLPAKSVEPASTPSAPLRRAA